MIIGQILPPTLLANFTLVQIRDSLPGDTTPSAYGMYHTGESKKCVEYSIPGNTLVRHYYGITGGFATMIRKN